MSAGNAIFVNYYDRQFLRTQDFTDEQRYHLTMRWRHNIAQHIWGIVHGLTVAFDATSDSFTVGPGLAVDGYGREVILQEPRGYSTRVFDERVSDALDILIGYSRSGVDRMPPGYDGCRLPNAGETPFTRWREQPLVWLATPDTDRTGRRMPVSVPEGDWNFEPQRAILDDPDAVWPVFLGTIIRERINDEWQYRVDLANRPYAGLVGWMIEDPAERGKVEIGSEAGTTRRFAVFIPDGVADTGPYEQEPRLEIQNDGTIQLRGDTALLGNLTVAEGAFAFGLGAQPAASEPPWRIYHCENTVTEDDDDGTTVERDVEELRIEMAGGSGGLNRVLIGAWDPETKTFEPCVTVTDDCNVTVHGDLIVAGELIEEQPRAAAKITTEAQYQVLASYVTGMNASQFNVAEDVQIALAMTAPALNLASELNRAAEPTLRAITTSLRNDETRERFLALLEEDGEFSDVRQSLRDALGGS